MSKKGQAAVSLISLTVGAGLIFVGYNSYVSVGADDPYTKDNSTLLIVLIIAGLVILALGLIIFFNLLRSNKKSNKQIIFSK